MGQTLRHDETVWALGFSPDSRMAVTGSWDRTARLWETATGKAIGQPMQHLDDVLAVGFSPDGRTVMTGSYDFGVRLWPVPVPLDGDASRILLWAQVASGMELDDEGVVEVLDAKTWQQRRDEIARQGGPPQFGTR